MFCTGVYCKGKRNNNAMRYVNVKEYVVFKPGYKYATIVNFYIVSA
jgi:hypothetical protein